MQMVPTLGEALLAVRQGALPNIDASNCWWANVSDDGTCFTGVKRHKDGQEFFYKYAFDASNPVSFTTGTYYVAVVSEGQVTDPAHAGPDFAIQGDYVGTAPYKGVDVKGKTIVVLVGDPPVPAPNDPSKLDAATFGGRAMTYYGRWSYKYETGAKLGAAP